ncbi:DegV family protein [Clostridium frigidicarnis]|uniref:EDD domain protein, DegV family n=1 Tax=Clostridium frigidicarnis TaxID=84698 RepID=A0A1I0ZEK8_9CLOT|nr:DegV family protein [Clostridium frigidicarnis]SFB22643.1 EDD domain protein, DegV family [Clostridium frigidicarnis]
MEKCVIMTDSCCDLPIEYINEKNVPYVKLSCNFDDKEYADDFGTTLSYKKFFDGLRNGIVPKTSQPSSQAFYDKFKELIDDGNDIIYLCVSSGLSGTFNGANVARNMILEEYPEANIDIIDCLTGSLGQGLIVKKAIELKEEKNATRKEIVSYIEEIKMKVNTYILVDDLSYLKKGGRISGAAATIGMVLHVKPVLTLNDEGRVIPILKVKGRKKSLAKLVEIAKERMINPKEEIVTICHGDCLDEALKLKEKLINELEVKEVLINYIGNAVGAYSGADALAIFFMGEERQNHII